MERYIMPTLKPVDKKEKNLLIKMSFKDFEEIKRQAEKYTKGNVSDWVRYAGKLEPRKEDVKDEKK